MGDMREATSGQAEHQPLVDALLSASQGPLMILDEQGQILAVNRAAEELLPDSIGARFPERCGMDAHAAFEAALAGRCASFCAPLGEGHVAWRLLPVVGSQGAGARVVASGQDTAAVIEERRDLFHKVLDALPIGINIFNAALMRTFYMNDAYVTIHGWPREIVMDGFALHERVIPDPEVRKRVLDKIQQDLASGDPSRMRWNLLDIVTQSGDRRHLLAINIPLPELGLLVGTIQDVTELWHARLELEQSERRFRIIAERTGQIVYDCDLETGRVHWAGAIERVTGYSAEELAKVDRLAWQSMVHPEDRAVFDRRHDECSSSIGGCEVEYRLRCKDGSYVWIEDSATVVQEGSDPARMLGRMKDISDRVRAEAERKQLSTQLQRAQRMELIGRLAGGIAHDFNNLLTVILGNVTLAQVGIQGDRLADSLSEIHQAAESAASLTRQLLSFSRTQVIEPRVLNLGEALERLRRLLVHTLGENIELSLALRAQGRTLVDPTQLEQIVMNLVVNARDAMPDGGRLLLETADVVLDEGYCERHGQAAAGHYVLLAVSDSGSGLTKEVRAHMFEPFFTTKDKGKGTGLGLATVYGAVKQNGGLIEVYSEMGCGTTFKIYFPRAEGEPELILPPGPRSGEGLPTGTETILLVEDDLKVRQFAAGFLSNLGYRVLAAAGGAEAIELLGRCPGTKIHLLFTDVVMPGMTGRELAEKLLVPLNVPRVLYCSGYTEDVVVRHGVLKGGIAFLPKPYSPERLATKVREVLDAPAPSGGADPERSP